MSIWRRIEPYDPNFYYNNVVEIDEIAVVVVVRYDVLNDDYDEVNDYYYYCMADVHSFVHSVWPKYLMMIVMVVLKIDNYYYYCYYYYLYL